MATCRYCGGHITFRHIEGRRVPIHLSGGCRGAGRHLGHSKDSGSGIFESLGECADQVVAFFATLNKIRCAQDDASKAALLQDEKFVDTIFMWLSTWVICFSILVMHIIVDDRLGFFKNVWSSFLALVVSILVSVIWVMVESERHKNYLLYRQFRGLPLSRVRIFLPHMLFLMLVVTGIVMYKITY